MTPLDQHALFEAVDAAQQAGIDRDPRRLIGWAYALLGDGLMMTTSFQKSGMVILHIVREVAPGLPVYFLDTGFHFPETLAFAERMRRDWHLNIVLQRPALVGDAFRARYGALHERDPDLCCHLNKVDPQAALLTRYQGWITGIRRDQAVTRSTAEPLERLEGGKLKVQPLARWTRPEVEAYVRAHDLPLHPLFTRGYASIGCAPCTRPCMDPTNERAGRWAGTAKTECGLHTFWKPVHGVAPSGPPASGESSSTAAR